SIFSLLLPYIEQANAYPLVNFPDLTGKALPTYPVNSACDYCVNNLPVVPTYLCPSRATRAGARTDYASGQHVALFWGNGWNSILGQGPLWFQSAPAAAPGLPDRGYQRYVGVSPGRVSSMDGLSNTLLLAHAGINFTGGTPPGGAND